jgi:hypothetical protein
MIPLPLVILGVVLSIAFAVLIVHLLWSIDTGDLRVSKGWLLERAQADSQQETRQ